MGTSIGHTQSMEGVLALFRAAMNYRHDVLSLGQEAELEGWVKGSKVRHRVGFHWLVWSSKAIREKKERTSSYQPCHRASPCTPCVHH